MQAWVGTDLANLQANTVSISTTTILRYAHLFRVADWHQGRPARAAQAERVSTCLNSSLERVAKRMLGKVDAPRQHEGGGREQGVGSSARYRGSKTGVVEGRQPLRMGPHASHAHVPYDSPPKLKSGTRGYGSGCATSASICGRAGRMPRRYRR
jgi:hypothetical protein